MYVIYLKYSGHRHLLVNQNIWVTEIASVLAKEFKSQGREENMFSCCSVILSFCGRVCLCIYWYVYMPVWLYVFLDIFLEALICRGDLQKHLELVNRQFMVKDFAVLHVFFFFFFCWKLSSVNDETIHITRVSSSYVCGSWTFIAERDGWIPANAPK